MVVSRQDIYNMEMKAISIRQPWAWLIVNGYKDIENRSWPTKVRGRVYIHAGKRKVTKTEYEEFKRLCRKRDIKKIPAIDEFKTMGIVGSAIIADCVERSRSPWYQKGNYGFVLMKARKEKYRLMKGNLGFFSIKEMK